MSVLRDASILARPELVTPFRPKAVSACSVDLHLGAELLRLPYGQTLDPERDQATVWQSVPLRDDGRWLLGARELYLGATLEAVMVPDDMVAILHGVSSLGRLGLLIHVTAGVVDAGWQESPLTLEVVSLGGPIFLRPGMRIAQLTFHLLDAAAERPYVGRYARDRGVVPSRAYLDVDAAR
jgi:dCTP deaminase